MTAGVTSETHPVTLITGARRGIGEYLARHYVERGHTVIGCSRNAVENTPPGYEHYAVDVTNEAEVRRMFADIRQKHGGLDHLINNAGIAATGHSLLTGTDTVRRVFDTNVVGAFTVARESAKVMKKRQTGRIVNFVSAAAPLLLAGEAAYGASKGAIVTLTGILARELGPLGITVNAVGPTPIETDLIRAMPQDKVQALIARQAIPRPGTFADIANAVDFFLKPESSFVTGQVLYLGGLI